ncbi:hypothetical protein ACUTQ5_05420 [Serratia sp. NA_112.1]|uniref:hypothetical protein n=1 Tax=Serratia sp. NA_112.1 TaxID=3415665 RepID=UPI004046D229
MATIPTHIHPLLAVSFNVATDFTVFATIAEAAPHFVYPIRHNPLNRKNSFLLSAFLQRTKLLLARMD